MVDLEITTRRSNAHMAISRGGVFGSRLGFYQNEAPY